VCLVALPVGSVEPRGTSRQCRQEGVSTFSGEDQMIALLTLMKELGILDETHYEEFRDYLMHSLTSQAKNG